MGLYKMNGTIYGCPNFATSEIFIDESLVKNETEADVTYRRLAAMHEAAVKLGEKRMTLGAFVLTKTQVMALPHLSYDLRLAVVVDIE